MSVFASTNISLPPLITRCTTARADCLIENLTNVSILLAAGLQEIARVISPLFSPPPSHHSAFVGFACLLPRNIRTRLPHVTTQFFLLWSEAFGGSEVLQVQVPSSFLWLYRPFRPVFHIVCTPHLATASPQVFISEVPAPLTLAI